jgi:hypothetical protein
MTTWFWVGKDEVIKEELDLGYSEAQSDKSFLVEGISDG